MKKYKEWLSIQLAKNPGRIVLIAILLFNIAFLALSGAIISSLSIDATRNMGFWEAIFYTITMILDAGCIQFVVADVGTTGLAVILICLIVIVMGMVTFTGAVIGYLTNYISAFIENANSGTKKINLSDHVVVLNWNTRAAEIINDMLYCEEKQKIVVLSDKNKNEVEREINESISDTITRENESICLFCAEMNIIQKYFYKRKHFMQNKLIIIVREGEPYSVKQLRDISLEKAKSVIILGNDINNSTCKYDYEEKIKNLDKGNSQTIKTLIQVANITGAEYSDDNQKIIVEIDDTWTLDLVEKIIRAKQVQKKCNIVPIKVNKVLGQILSQFSLMPELNLVYKELFSNKGAAFYSKPVKAADISYNSEYMKKNETAIPLTCMEKDGIYNYYYVSGSEKDIDKTQTFENNSFKVKLNENYWMAKKSVIILGHNSKCYDIMEGFNSFREEWNYSQKDPKNTREIVEIVIIDNKVNLEKMNYYKDYPYVIKTVEANIYDKDIIIGEINTFIDSHMEDTSILILSDDTASNEDIDSNALANLIYVQDIIKDRKEANPNFDTETIDVIVEILNPKNHDVVTSYSINNVVISNRYISKMLTQIGEKDALFDFYNDILTYDAKNALNYESKEVYIKPVGEFFEEIPGICTAKELIRAVYESSIANNTEKTKNMSVIIGYIKPGGNTILFTGKQSDITVELHSEDKLVIFSNH